ncbi:MAG: hypothetical protein PHQ04_09005 [Opitutaceae bacterium]|nr:hypothetical protein [Opitutaceae bacterium]
MILRFAVLATVFLASSLFLGAQIGPEEGEAPLAVPMPPPLLGKVDGSAYVAANGIYRVTVPVLPELGGQITDDENVVTFEDAFNTHISIASFPLNLEQKWELDTRGLRDYLAYFFGNFVLGDFRQRFPGSSIESAKFITGLFDGSMLVYTLLPGGSFFEGRNSIMGAAAEPPVTAKRGNLCFVRSGSVFVISTELAERATQRHTYDLTTEKEDELLRQRLLGLAHNMEFAQPAATPGK